MQATAFDTPPWWQRVLPMFRGFDGPLLAAVLLLAGLGLTIMYSSGFDHGTRFVMHGRNMLLAAAIMFVVAQAPPQRLMRLAVPAGAGAQPGGGLCGRFCAAGRAGGAHHEAA